VNPYTVVIEEVPAFLESGAGWILRHALTRMGYTVDARIMDPAEQGELTGRRRAVSVATSDVSIAWPAPKACSKRLAEILDATADAWFDETSKPWLFKHWREQTARGNNFASQVLDGETTRVGCISKRYFAGQGDGAVVKHPTEAGKYRWLTLDEVRRLQGLPENYYLGESKTTAGEVLGQGVHVGMFRAVIEGASR
jgi:site-specific DNA-cytosine methylase